MGTEKVPKIMYTWRKKIMSVCKFIASDVSLQEMSPSKDYPVHIDIDNGIIDDGK